MSVKCKRRNPLIRSGTQQGERQRPALDPTYFGVDERDPADLILFAERFSHHLKYYAANNSVDNDWSPFFSRDIAAILAGLSEQPVTAFQEFARALQDYLTADPDREEADLAAHLKLLFYLPCLLLKTTGDYFDRLPPEHTLRGFMRQVMSRDLAEPLADVVAYYKGAVATLSDPITAKPLLDDTKPLAAADYNTAFDDTDPRIQLPSAVTVQVVSSTALSTLALSEQWLAAIAPGGWAAYYASIPADTSPYDASPGNVYNQIYDALTYNLLAKALERLFQALQRIALEAATYLEAALTDFAGHTPHYALWLAFLRLFAFNQAQLNTLTQRHLDYYYKEVLHLCLQPAQPDQVHLLFTLNKNVQERLLPAATTLLRAGKDATGKEVLYRLDNDFVVNPAQVAALKAFYRPTSAPDNGPNMLLYAAAVVNSSDGAGAALPKEDPQWPPFGPASAPAARIGFAIADRQLFLREGRREIQLTIAWGYASSFTITPEQRTMLNSMGNGLKVSLTGEEGWFESAPILSSDKNIVPTPTLNLTIALSAEDPPVVPYDPAVHGEGFTTTEPMLKIEFAFATQKAKSVALFNILSDLPFTEIDLRVFVRGVRNVSLQNEAGVIDSAKPFLPFGPTTITNSALILGSSEVFSKKLAWLSLNVQWEQAINSTDFFLKNGPEAYKLRLRHLKQGVWEGAGSVYDIDLFPTDNRIDLPAHQLSELGVLPLQRTENEPFSNKSQTGFLKLELNTGFGQQTYTDQKTLNLINLANTSNWSPTSPTYNFDASTKLPKQPYTPKLNELTLNYLSESQTPARFFHLHPFGFTEESNSSGRLFPELANEGELYIGIADLAPPQRLTLLFQVVDGTANPLKEETTLQWHYLHGNEWVALPAQAVDDKTHNLTGSGIVGIAMPADADTVHTILPTGLHWLRLAVASDSDALNNLLTIDAQAATATFVDQGNDPAFLATPLAPGVITKLKTSDAAIKQISQPYGSFGGKPQENDSSFTTRVSERLRHKDRGVTMWDYEHLILQAFPQIYKVRCINHTALVRDAANNILADNEVKPGHVLVVTLPYVQLATARDPLRPYTDRKTLGEIDRFLRQRISPFVQLEVQNPKFEEVQVKFNVAFTAEIADIAFYLSELNAAILRYLSPWAYAEGAEISFGGQWHKSAIIDFVEEQSYVDYVKDFEMYHKVDSTLADSAWVRIDEEVVAATTARSILVSHPLHTIREIS